MHFVLASLLALALFQGSLAVPATTSSPATLPSLEKTEQPNMFLHKRQVLNNALSGYGGYGGYGFPRGVASGSSTGYNAQNYRNTATSYSPFGVSNSFNAGSSAAGYSNSYIGYYAKDADAKKPTNVMSFLFAKILLIRNATPID
ncbi:hypothetical protein PTTG_04973 [Puccinia triticina 1-1 BBBD Race 1]|uniref:Uncharacterized protein n=2 Tax=Puccinia triticina TaxID=208348 RepID=A0A180GJ83_PUCT1|nr:uncharacterized protein PtA15_3A439 [Puccinia triticina]OAV92760.1 hypothetical protein PTTG_04973 [Puccinia triticina 1-1 BBBD Race 1]WAQ83072.1 hypothetical protein PtA15_3A439 [Puccinia triticina]WAR53910.1 hypothetical protein PtB15_3B419 [Puccinia triticina]